MNSKQIVLVLESKTKNGSDFMYVRSFINHYFGNNGSIKITSIPMNGKNNYNSKSVIKKIDDAKKEYKNGESIVVYGYDTDNVNNNKNDYEYDKSITQYCETNGYKLVFFCRDIEEVFLGKRIKEKDKGKEAEKYLRSRKISAIDMKNLISREKTNGKSNLKLILQIALEKNNEQ